MIDWPQMPDCKLVCSVCLHCDGEGIRYHRIQVGQTIYAKQLVCRACRGGGLILRPMTEAERISQN